MTTALAPTQPRVAFTPDVLDMYLDIRPFQGLEAKGRMVLDTRPLDASPAKTTQHMKVYQQGNLVQDEIKTAEFSPEERTAAQGVRDALAGTTFLTDSVPYAEGEVPADTLRVTFNDHEGTRRMFDVAAKAPAEQYVPFHQAIETYAKAAGFRK